MKVANEPLQRLCRMYLMRLRHMARKHGLGGFVEDVLRANRRGECEGTRKEVEMLARLCDDERLSRQDVPSVLGKSYRGCVEDGDFERLKRMRRLGIYSKVSAMMLKMKRSKK